MVCSVLNQSYHSMSLRIGLRKFDEAAPLLSQPEVYHFVGWAQASYGGFETFKPWQLTINPAKHEHLRVHGRNEVEESGERTAIADDMHFSRHRSRCCMRQEDKDLRYCWGSGSSSPGFKHTKALQPRLREA